jgi:DNA invertase Pin-like site-specific DNA recombinase
MRVLIYARYSSENQREASIDDQIRVCETYAARQGWRVMGKHSDQALSGATTLRPGYQALLSAVRSGETDIILAESLDRFSRDLEHIANLFKQVTFNQARIFTLSEGEVSELHIGLKGTMGALYLKDLADKTKRGLEGRIRAGRLIGSPAYGYTVVRQIDAKGELDRGLRAIDPERAGIVRRIFADYVGGASPRRIAQQLNAEGVTGPSGGIWYDGSIRGRPGRQDGILRNELYAGRIVWRRQINAKDPRDGSTVKRKTAADTHVRVDVPDLRIVDEALWQRAQQRLLAEAAPLSADAPQIGYAFWDRRRPRHLLSQKVVCGVCGRHFTSRGKDYLGCMAAKNGSCGNARTIRRVTLEAQVMHLLAKQLMQPDLVSEFIAAFNQEWTRLAAEVRSQAVARQRERAALDRKIANLVDSISDGRSSPAILAKLDELEARRAALGQATDTPPTPALHPGIADTYARKVESLGTTLENGQDPELLEAARALIDKVVIHPPNADGDPPGVELVGELMAMLRAAGVGGVEPGSGHPADDPVLSMFVSSIKEAPGAKPLPAGGTARSTARRLATIAPRQAPTAGSRHNSKTPPSSPPCSSSAPSPTCAISQISTGPAAIAAAAAVYPASRQGPAGAPSRQ